MTDGYCDEHSGMCRKIDSLKELMEIRFSALDSTTALIREDLERRLDTMNHIRRQLEQQASSFMPRKEIELIQGNMLERIEQIRSRLDVRAGERRWSDYIIIVLIGVAIMAFQWYLNR